MKLFKNQRYIEIMGSKVEFTEYGARIFDNCDKHANQVARYLYAEFLEKAHIIQISLTKQEYQNVSKEKQQRGWQRRQVSPNFFGKIARWTRKNFWKDGLAR